MKKQGCQYVILFKFVFIDAFALQRISNNSLRKAQIEVHLFQYFAKNGLLILTV